MKSDELKPTDLIPVVDAFAAGSSSAEELMTLIVELLHDRLPKYNWVGFYLLEKGATPPMLVLGPFRGAATPHTRIPLHQGICGAAATRGETVVVDDVKSDSRYLACSVETKSEIVVPVFVNGEVVGELDIDSHEPATFGDSDRSLCEHTASVVSAWLAQRTMA
jgi:L-methionine (R)-S-oxide reductase